MLSLRDIAHLPSGLYTVTGSTEMRRHDDDDGFRFIYNVNNE